VRLPLIALLGSVGPVWVEGPLPAGAVADYQLGGGYPAPPGVTVVVRDSTDTPEPGLFNICYVNGFQTQPGADWPLELLLRGPDGRALADAGWPDEVLLDVSTPAAREANLARLAPVIGDCAAKGFDAVEFDNLDSYTRSDGQLDIDDAVAFARLLVATAGRLGLPAGQKNTGELGVRGRDEAGFAFAVTEECHRWDECAAFTGVYGRDQVLGIEYADDLRGTFAETCSDPDRPGSLILRDRLLSRAGSAVYVFEACP
jgi:Glycoside-hydrolase family GH114